MEQVEPWNRFEVWIDADGCGFVVLGGVLDFLLECPVNESCFCECLVRKGVVLEQGKKLRGQGIDSSGGQAA